MRPYRRGQQGQTATEYVLVIAVATIAIVAAAYTLLPSVHSGINTLAQDVSQVLQTHELNATPRQFRPATRPGFGPNRSMSAPQGMAVPYVPLAPQGTDNTATNETEQIAPLSPFRRCRLGRC